MHAFTLFLVFDTTERFLSCTLPVSRKRFTRRDIVDLFGTGESGNVPVPHLWRARTVARPPLPVAVPPRLVAVPRTVVDPDSAGWLKSNIQR
jgi:hypothetical protein